MSRGAAEAPRHLPHKPRPRPPRAPPGPPGSSSRTGRRAGARPPRRPRRPACPAARSGPARRACGTRPRARSGWGGAGRGRAGRAAAASPPARTLRRSPPPPAAAPAAAARAGVALCGREASGCHAAAAGTQASMSQVDGDTASVSGPGLRLYPLLLAVMRTWSLRTGSADTSSTPTVLHRTYQGIS